MPAARVEAAPALDDPPALVAALLGLGVLEPAEVFHPSFTVEEAGGRNAPALVRTPRQTLTVKRHVVPGARAREVGALRRHAATRGVRVPELACERDGFVVLRTAPGLRSWALVHAGAALPPGALRDLGAALARVHASAPSGEEPVPPSLVTHLRWPGPELALESPAVRGLVADWQRDGLAERAGLAGGTEGGGKVVGGSGGVTGPAGGAGAGELVVSHGDVRTSNLLAGAAGEVPVLVDWELAGLAPPAADLGAALAMVLAHGVARPGSVAGARACAAALLDAYRAAAPGGAPTLRALVRETGARLLHTALEHAVGAAESPPLAGRLSALAARFLTAPVEGARLLGLVGGAR